MITGHQHVVRGSRVYGILHCMFDMHTGEIERWAHSGYRHSLSLSEPGEPYLASFRFSSPDFSAAIPPDFGPYELAEAEAWLTDTVARLDRAVAATGFPGLRKEESGRSVLCSSLGRIAFFAETGEIIEIDGDFGSDGQCSPVFIDVCEWRSRYPGELISDGVHDILDFGYWYTKIKDGGKIFYEPPCGLGMRTAGGCARWNPRTRGATDMRVKPVSEILSYAAAELRDNGHECVTTPIFWDCDCESDFRRDNLSEECLVCGAKRNDCPDSILCEVLEDMVHAYEKRPLDGVLEKPVGRGM